VGLHDDVVGRVQRLALEAVEDDGDAAVVLGPGDAAGVVLAGDQTPLAIARVAVGVVRGLAEDAHRAGLLVPAHDPVVRDVAPEEGAEVAEPDRPLAPAEAGGEPLDTAVADPVAREAGVEDADGGVGITDELGVHAGSLASVVGPTTSFGAWARRRAWPGGGGARCAWAPACAVP